MSARLLAASLLLAAAALCADQVALDGTAFHMPIRQQWRASSQHPGGVRPARRNMVGGAPVSPAPAVLSVVDHTPFEEPHGALPPFLVPIFVPPRAS